MRIILNRFKMKKIICEKCGCVFTCESSNIENCWCFKIPPVKIDINLKNCICEDCLKTNKKTVDQWKIKK